MFFRQEIDFRSFPLHGERFRKAFVDGTGMLWFLFVIGVFSTIYLFSSIFPAERLSREVKKLPSSDSVFIFSTDVYEIPAHSGKTSFRTGDQSRSSQNQIATRQLDVGSGTKSPGSFDACRSFFRTPGRACPFDSLKKPLYLWNRILLI